MVRVTQMSLLFVLFLASSAFGEADKPGSEAEFNAFIKEQIKVVPKPTDSRCPAGWVRHEQRCFIYFPQALDWASAEAQCLTRGANLVSIHNENEYQLVKALIRAYDPKEDPTWLGLNSCEKRDSWFWSDGTKANYAKWNKDEPNYVNGECCVHLNYGGQKDWNDIPCSNVYPFVCSKETAFKLTEKHS
ncbi:lactose-binding lectin l-2-like [Colossoma macropomum]|uniref:lactose-binding lectin l-2-like n=1 Tax=Colossoma macropomum TaxID=42526 RepID=UPI001863A086|nr:lactose-binding lectin l-2-like [Colossoma macropomum]XP_036453655.1 lactose-binding lectin l-2-like [Colossoma macropomum]XP_036453656.1 lactose-binding lectin l-2-like [Colossoma macropomum]